MPSGPQGQECRGSGTAPKWVNDLVAGGKTREDLLLRQNTAAKGRGYNKSITDGLNRTAFACMASSWFDKERSLHGRLAK